MRIQQQKFCLLVQASPTLKSVIDQVIRDIDWLDLLLNDSRTWALGS